MVWDQRRQNWLFRAFKFHVLVLNYFHMMSYFTHIYRRIILNTLFYIKKKIYFIIRNWRKLMFALTVDQTLSIWLGIQFRQRNSQIKDWRPNFFWICLAWHDPETQGVQELILDLFKVYSWLTYGWKSVRFWWYFHTFHKNGDEVLLKTRLQTPTKKILGAVLFMYLLTNTNIARIKFFSDPTCCCLADYGHEVSKVWCK